MLHVSFMVGPFPGVPDCGRTRLRGIQGCPGIQGGSGLHLDEALGSQYGPVHTLPVHQHPEVKAHAQDERRSAPERIKEP